MPQWLNRLGIAIGPGLVFAGWQLVAPSYTVGVLVAYVGFLICLAECIWEPALLSWPYQIQVVCIGLVLFFLVLFTIGVVVRAPLV